MASFTVKHEIGCDVDTFWKTFFDEAYNRELFFTHLGFPEYRLEKRETETEIACKVVARPKLSMPAPITKLIGDSFRYTEEGVFDKATRIWRWKVTPSVHAEKLRTEGVVRVEPIGGDRARRVADVTIEAKIFGIGGLVESSSEKQVRKTWDDTATFMNTYVKRAPR